MRSSFGAGEICELRLHTVTCLALLSRKTTPNKQRAAKTSSNGHELSPGYTEKATTGPSLRKLCLFLSSFLYSYKVFKSFVICKTVSKIAVIYAPRLGHLCQNTLSLYTDVVLFLFSFFSKTSARSRAKRVRKNESEARVRNHPHYPLALEVNKSPPVYILSPAFD